MSIGDSVNDGDNYYIKLGSGLEGGPLGGGVPEMPAGVAPFFLALCGFVYTAVRGSRREL